jgi:3-hexulose-6-phosphate synthase
MASTRPLLQLALDCLELEAALAIAQRAAPHVDVIEAGTPLCKSEGIRAVRLLRALFPDKILLADLKSPDCGALEAGMAFAAGADWTTVAGTAPLATLRAATSEGARRGKQVWADLTGVPDIAARASALRQAGIAHVVLHRGIDEELAGRGWTAEALALTDTLASLGLQVAVAGGVSAETFERFVGHPVAVLVIGRAITGAPDAGAAAQWHRRALDRLWN